MKTIVLYFYSCANLGDDLFVKTLAEYFCECRIRLIANPKCVPKNLGSNVSLHPYSVLRLLIGKLRSIVGENNRMGILAQHLDDHCLRMIASYSDAYVYIGGSIFMEHVRGVESEDFSNQEKPKFDLESTPQAQGNSFVIGANLGPVYSLGYWKRIRESLKGYTHVCLRDWASYSRVRDLAHVHYAPDVLFLTPKPHVVDRGENVVISLVEMERHTADTTVVDSYYQIMAETVNILCQRGIPVTLVSFCQWEGDEQAIDRVMTMVQDAKGISRLCYHRDAAPILECIAGASYVIGSRFHSTILAISFGKPVFPVAYNCKTEHYLQDLGFSGRYGDLKNMVSLKVEDLLFNYDQRIIVDCSDHKNHAAGQFQALWRFLELDKQENANV